MPIVTAQERVGTVLAGKYRLDRILGEGGMGVVYAGQHLKLNRRIAVKFLHAQYAQHATVVSRFFSEAQAAASLEHPNVVDIYDLDHAEDGSAYIVLELLDGESLSALLERRGRLAPAEVVSILVPVLDALQRAHENGIVHRDLKPDNIFLARDRAGKLVPKVLDFGVAKLVDAQRAGATATGTIVGTPAYMAPEQAMGRKDVGPWSDVWSMGVVLYECLTGRFPFDFDPEMPPTAVVVTVVSSTAHPLARYWPEAPAHLRECVDRALAKEPADRWQRMLELRNALEGSPIAHAPTVLDDTGAFANAPPSSSAAIASPPESASPSGSAAPTPFGWISQAEREQIPTARPMGLFAAGGVAALALLAGALGLAWTQLGGSEAVADAEGAPTVAAAAAPPAPPAPAVPAITPDAGIAASSPDAGAPVLAQPSVSEEHAPRARRSSRASEPGAPARARAAPVTAPSDPAPPAAQPPARRARRTTLVGDVSVDDF